MSKGFCFAFWAKKLSYLFVVVGLNKVFPIIDREENARTIRESSTWSKKGIDKQDKQKR